MQFNFLKKNARAAICAVVGIFVMCSSGCCVPYSSQISSYPRLSQYSPSLFEIKNIEYISKVLEQPHSGIRIQGLIKHDVFVTIFDSSHRRIYQKKMVLLAGRLWVSNTWKSSRKLDVSNIDKETNRTWQLRFERRANDNEFFLIYKSGEFLSISPDTGRQL